MNQQSNNCLNDEKGECLYRAGIENNENKSFLLALSYLVSHVKGSEQPKPNISFIIKKIEEKITIDNILNFHNGNIPSIFYNKKGNSEINTSKYKKSKIYLKYKKDKMNNELNKLINYENFMKYLKDLMNMLIIFIYGILYHLVFCFLKLKSYYLKK